MSIINGIKSGPHNFINHPPHVGLRMKSRKISFIHAIYYRWQTLQNSSQSIAVILAKPCKISLQWRHNEHDGISNHQPHDCLLNHLFGRRSKKTSKFRVTGLCAGNSPVTDKFPSQRASNAENVSIWWRHHFQKGSSAKTLLGKELFLHYRDAKLSVKLKLIDN